MSAEGQPAAVNLDMEQALLGCLISAPEAFAVASGTLRPEHFFEPAHSLILQAMLERVASGAPNSIATLADALRPNWNVPLIGDVTFGQYVAKLTANAAPAMMVPGYVSDIRDQWALRSISEAANRRAQESGSPAAHLSAMFDEIDTVRAALSEAKATRESAGQSADSLLQQVNSIRMGVEPPRGATTGFLDLDRVMLGYRPGELVVLGARPGMGKTTFGTSSLRQSAKAGNGMLLFSLELPREAVAARLMADQIYDNRHPLTHSKIRTGKDITDEEFWRLKEASQEFEKLPFEIDYAPRLAVSEIGARVTAARRRMERKGQQLRCVAIDYLKFVKATDRYRGQRTYEVGEITAGLREIGKEQEVCILLMTQLNRGIEAEKDKRPDLHHLRDSGDIEADADVVMFLYRDAYYIEKSPEFRAGDGEAVAKHDGAFNELEVIIAKNRNGPTVTVDLFCDIGASALRNGTKHFEEPR